MDDSKLITENKIENEDVVHLIARMESNNNSNNNQNNPEENRNNNETGIFSTLIRANPPPFFPFNHFREPWRSNWGTSNYRIISSTYSNVGRNNSEYAPQPTINSDEIRETIAQNLLEVQNIIDYGNYNEFNENKIDDNENINMNVEKDKKEDIYDMNCFDLDKRILVKGQWVDVKDTVEQWLDAQVIEVSEDNKMVKIHYNHWSTRWDEWINTNSPRIMPFRYHTRQITLTNYNSPFPNKKPDMGVTLLSFENLNRNGCVHPSSLTQQRNRNNSNNNNNNNNSNDNNSNNNSNNNTENNNNILPNQANESSNSTNSNNTNQNYISINITRRSRPSRYAEPPPPIPSPKHQEPDPENHIIKNLGADGFIGVLNEFGKINKIIEGLSSSLLSEHKNNTEILTPNKLSEIQTKSYYNLKRIIPILDRTGRIYSDISAFFEHSIKTNQLELISRNLFSDVDRINEDLKYFPAQERRRISQEILGRNSRRENRSGTVNFVPPVNKFDTKLKNYLPIIDTPFMIGKNDPQISPILDVFIQNNNDDDMSSNEENSVNSRNNNNENNNNTNNNNNSFLRNIQVENFNVEYNSGINRKDTNEEKDNENNKLLGIKTKRSKNKEKNKNSDDDEDDNDNSGENENTKKNKRKK